MRRRFIGALVGSSLAVGLGSRRSEAGVRGGGKAILEFNTMIGIPRPFAGVPANAVFTRGIPGGGLPWVIDDAHGKIHLNGDIDVKVRGLVFDPDDPVVQERGLAGINTVPSFKAIVSCLTVSSEGDIEIINMSTGLFPADEAGNCMIKDSILLPDPCIAPIVFVTSPGGAWFATTGF
jgi:hypothetical protein